MLQASASQREVAAHACELRQQAGVWNTVTGDVSSFVGKVASAIASIPGKIMGTAGSMLNAGKSIISSLFSGMTGALDKAGGFVTSVAQDIWNGLKGFINARFIDPIKHFQFNFSALGYHHTFEPFGSIPELAKGGIVPATPGGQLVRVAEAGQAEAVIPLPNGLKSLGTSQGVVNNFNIDGSKWDELTIARAVTRRQVTLSI